ncbi:MAG: hypothetical protein CMN78_01135 [Spirochaetales bacterium]|nr:hypothetical protein [Spirochaetales bacterium]
MVIRRLEYGFGITFTALEVGTEVKEKEVITNVIFSDGDRYLINFDWHQRNYGLIEPFPLEGYLAFGFSRGPFLPNIGYEKTEIVFVMRKIR